MIEAAPADDPLNSNFARNTGIAIALFFAVLAGALTWNKNRQDKEPLLSDAARAECSDRLDSITSPLTVVDIDAATARVNQSWWGMQSNANQRELLSLLACSAFGRDIEQLSGSGQVARVVNSETGRVLTRATGGKVSGASD